MNIDKKYLVAFVAAFAFTACAGDVGPIGPEGAMGAAGADGPNGTMGTIGSDGVPGGQGEVGANGEVGPQGPPGPTWQVIPSWLKGEYESNAAKWWEWANSLPATGHPLDYAAPGDCNLGQEGPVFYLGGSFGGASVPTGCTGSACTGTAATVTRDCTIPEGKAIFFPLVNVLYNNVDESPLLTNQELMENARGLGTAATNLSATIDGMAISNIADYHVQTQVYEFPIVAGAPNGPDDGSADFTQGAEDSYYVMLSPLPPGTHTIHFTGALHFTTAEHGFDWTFDLDVTYNITVAASGS